MNKEVKNYPELRAYLEGSNESNITRKNLRRIFDEKLKDFPEDKLFSMLDVGSSDGEMSFPLAKTLRQEFNKFRYTAVEPEKPAFDRLNQIIREQNVGWAKTYNLTIEEYLKKVKGKKDLFDLILFAQSLYHMPKEEWDEIISNSLRLLKPNGIIIIILDSHKGEAYRLKNLIMQGKADTLEFGDLYSAEDLEDLLNKKGIEYLIEKFSIYMFVKRGKNKLFEFARHLAFLYRTFPERILSNNKDEVGQFLESIQKDGEYILENDVKVIIFRK